MPDSASTDDLGSLATVMAALGSTSGVAALAPGTVIAGQYRVEGQLGAGGMGVVYRAVDEKLGRPVAIKVGTLLSADGLRRVEREAQAVAQLSHPNVVVVHQVGEVGGRVFIVMEHVAGGTARTWRERAPRTWREIVDLYLGAGAGLAAAHAAGLIHRDFKPDNVLVGEDGRPRVADFGLARLVGPQPEIDPDAPLGATLTETEAVLGTPAYMPPEQLAGEPVDARADQYAFAASLWEALYDARPFVGDTPRSLRAAIAATPPHRAASPRSPAPRAVEVALRRALAARRDDRWPDLPALLAALRRARDARRRRARIGGALGMVAIAATAVAVTVTRAPAATPCTDSASQLARVWNPARAARLATAFGATAWPALAATLDAYTRGWTTSHGAACRATRVARSQTEAMLDRRNLCLHRAASALDATLTSFERGSPATRARATDALAELPSLAACDAVDALGAEDPPPTDPTARAAVTATFDAVAAARVAYREEPARVTALSDAALALARQSGWRPVVADALEVSANAAWLEGDMATSLARLREGADLAMAGHSDTRAATILSDLAWQLADDRQDGEARMALRIAEALLTRTDDLAAHEAVLMARCRVEAAAGDYAAAVAAANARVALAERGGQRYLGAAHLQLAAVFLDARRPAEARTHADLAVAFLERAHGPEFHAVAYALTLRGRAAAVAGDLEPARADATRALAIYERIFGPDSAWAVPALATLGVVARNAGDAAGARAYWTRELAVLERDRDKRPLAAVVGNLALLDLEAGDLEAGLAQSQRALALLEATDGPEGGTLVDALVAIGYATRGLGRHAESRAALERCAAIATKAFGPSSASAVNCQIELGNTLVAAGDGAAAVRLLTPLVPLADQPDAARSPAQPFELRLALADAHWQAGDRAAAAKLVADAERRAGGANPGRGMVAQWRAAHGGRGGR
ncbi:MAG: serine/threonine protein kinase [Myxococcales bacterium]|nr:serine/threonine protein kinase [Myxococcales bacterium]